MYAALAMQYDMSNKKQIISYKAVRLDETDPSSKTCLQSFASIVRLDATAEWTSPGSAEGTASAFFFS